MIYVVGSGPTGVSCSHALLNKGLSVSMLDAGIELEPERQEAVRLLSQNPPEKWDRESLETIREKMISPSSGIITKYAYGSDFPYRGADRYMPVENLGTEALCSLARGGLSNVWGAVVLPYQARDIADWPIDLWELSPHYEAVLQLIDFAAVKDDLDSVLPLYSSAYKPLKPSRQALAFMDDMRSNRQTLIERGIRFGHARLAVTAEASGNAPGCVYCGMCMYGCPYGLIYSSSSTLKAFQRQPNFHYIKDVIVKRLVESGGQVKVLAYSRLSGEELEFTAERVYLACGPWSTAKILLESMEVYDRPLTMKDSAFFLFPWIRYKNMSDVTNERLHTLAQIFIAIADDSVCPYSVHLQIYTYNDLYVHAIKRRMGPAYALIKYFLKPLVGRLCIAHGNLHSQLSATISVRLERCPNSEAGSRVVAEASPNPAALRIIQHVTAKLIENRRLFQAVPLAPLLTIGKPGRGVHSGGTFPMSRDPSGFESDLLGRPTGFEKVHVVDASVFPTIPATSITLSAMANAHRIASRYGDT